MASSSWLPVGRPSCGGTGSPDVGWYCGRIDMENNFGVQWLLSCWLRLQQVQLLAVPVAVKVTVIMPIA